MGVMMRAIVLSVAISLGLASAAAAQSYVCEQTSMSRGGFVSIADARHFFPKRTSYRIRRSGTTSKPFGSGDARKVGNRVVMFFRDYKPWETEPRMRVRVSINLKTGRYSSRLIVPAGFVDGATASGQCRQG